MYRNWPVLLAVAIVLLGAAPFASGKDAYDGDTPLYRCSGNDQFDSLGNHWLRSGEEPRNVGDTDEAGVFAAMHWITGWPVEDKEDFTDVEDHAAVVPPRGIRLPVMGIRQAASEVRACWVLKPLNKGDERPLKLKDARKPITANCLSLPENLRTELPALSEVGQLRIDARKGSMYFFGAVLRLVPHDGSAYVGISRGFAVTLHKRSGDFRIVLPPGRGLNGSCGFLSTDD